jgi:hypothetical protein
MDIPDRLPPALPGEWPGKERLAAFEAYRAELGLTADELPMTHDRVNESVRWWNAGAPALDREPTPQSIMLAQLDGWLAAGATWPEGGVTLDEFRERMHKGDRENRMTRAAPCPDRPRSPRSRHAIAAAESDAEVGIGSVFGVPPTADAIGDPHFVGYVQAGQETAAGIVAVEGAVGYDVYMGWHPEW